ncbi:MAG: PilZ domain-containing protein, partial [Acetivibrio sp.]
MRLESLKIGRGIEIYVTRAGYRYRLVSSIEGVGIGKVYVTLIASGTRVFRFLDTDIVDLVYRDETHMLQWEKVTGSIEVLDGTKVHCLASRKEGTSFNRRNAFRISIDESIKMYFFRSKDENENEVKEETKEEIETDNYGNENGEVVVEEFEGYLKDLSENGAGIYTNRGFNIGDMIGFSLYTSYGAMYFKA